MNLSSDEITKESTLRKSSTLSWLMKCLILAPVIAVNSLMMTIVSFVGHVASIPIAVASCYQQLRSGDLSVLSLLNLIVTVLAQVVAILNIFWWVAGIWLAFLGEWGMIGYGTLVAFFGAALLPWLLMPTMLLTPIALAIEKTKNKVCIFVAGFLAIGYTSIIAALWVSKQFDFVLHHTHSPGFIPACFWSFGLATFPWSAMVSNQLDNEYEILTVLGIQASSIVLMIGFGFFHFSFSIALVTAGSILLVGALIQASLATVQQH